MAVARTSLGAFLSSAAAETPLFGAGATPGDLGVGIVETANQNMPTPSGWLLWRASAGYGSAGLAGASRTFVFYKPNLASADITAGLVLSDSGDHQNGVLLSYNGYDPITPLADTGGFVEQPVATTAVSSGFSGLDQTNVSVLDALLAVITTDRDSGTVSANTGANWNGISPAQAGTFILNQSSATGAGGGIILNELIGFAPSSGLGFSCNITSSAYCCGVLEIRAARSPVPQQMIPPAMLPLLCR